MEGGADSGCSRGQDDGGAAVIAELAALPRDGELRELRGGRELGEVAEETGEQGHQQEHRREREMMLQGRGSGGRGLEFVEEESFVEDGEREMLEELETLQAEEAMQEQERLHLQAVTRAREERKMARFSGKATLKPKIRRSSLAQAVLLDDNDFVELQNAQRVLDSGVIQPMTLGNPFVEMGRRAFGMVGAVRPKPREKFIMSPSSIIATRPESKIESEMPASASTATNKQHKQIPLRIFLRQYLASSYFGVVVDVLSTSFSVMACLFFVWLTYEEHLEGLFFRFEILFCVFFILEYLVRFYVSSKRLLFVLGWSSFVDLATILPVFFDLLTQATTLQRDTMVFKLLRFAKVLRVVRILRVHRIFLYFRDDAMRETARFVLNLFSISFITTGMIYQLENLLREEMLIAKMEFHDAFYFTVVTISTVGYGDVITYTDGSKVFISFVIMFSLIYIPMSTNALFRLFSEKSAYLMHRYKPSSLTEKHVLVLGNIDKEGARHFLQQFFHRDHGNNLDVHVVMMFDSDPSPELRSVIESTRYDLVVTYLRGSVFDAEDLKRARARDALACFVFADKFTDDDKSSDVAIMLQALAVKRHLMAKKGNQTKMCLQLNSPENLKRYLRSFDLVGSIRTNSRDIKEHGEAKQRFSAVHVTSVEDPNGTTNKKPFQVETTQKMRYTLLQPKSTTGNGPGTGSSWTTNGSALVHAKGGRNSIFGKASSFMGDESLRVANSMKYQAGDVVQAASATSTASPQESDIVVCINKIKMHLMAKNCLCPGITTLVSNLVISSDDRPLDTGLPWEIEFAEGCDYEIYRTLLSRDFGRIMYEDLARAVYLESETLIIGLEVAITLETRSDSAQQQPGYETISRVLLNPAGFLIPDHPSCKIFALIIARDKESAQLSSWATARKADLRTGANNAGNVTEVSPITPASPKANAFDNSAPAKGPASTEEGSQILKTAASHRQSKVASSFKVSKGNRLSNFSGGAVTPSKRNGIRELLEKHGLQVQSRAVAAARLVGRGGKEFEAQLPRAMTALEKQEQEILGMATESTWEFPSLQEATIKSHLSEEQPEIENHVVYTGSIEYLESFVGLIRKKKMGGCSRKIPIVILSEDMPTEKMWRKFNTDNIFFVQGSPLAAYDLIRAGIEYASSAVVSSRGKQALGSFSSCSRSADDMSEEKEELWAIADADSIFAHQGILRLNPDIEVITEIVNPDNIVFLETKAQLLSFHERQISLMRHSTQNVISVAGLPRDTSNATGLVGNNGAMEMEDSNWDPHNNLQASGLLASGCVFTLSLLDALICQSFYNPQIINVFHKLIAGDEDENTHNITLWEAALGSTASSKVFLVPVPRAFHGKKFKELFRYFSAEKQMLCIGLYRGVNARKLGLGRAGNRHRYVVTNPPASATLNFCDEVYVLSQTEPKIDTLPPLNPSLASIVSKVATVANRSRRVNPTPPAPHETISKADLLAKLAALEQIL
ncbi:Calcium-activated potassium channel slowpoke (dSlo) (BK channel) (Maxi K channel) (MaxiK) [Durusdinium trenchii]|uniref:Calcium-activated potassium channel slowpoke (DSlo) (BK channel) (Maxi K channel) (MaxiK) n=1 Tax=Durusdinium trenchii TaxID=1381693 RepID=A0ABP0SQ77_9DINO